MSKCLSCSSGFIPRYFIRSTVYNLLFYGLTAAACIICLPALFMPRRIFMGVVYGFVFCNDLLEKYILGLKFEVRGLENLPASGSYIVAAKHQSAYETTKLHILFDDPAIILKKELLKIPLWGRYLAKTEPIAIDRSSPKNAIKSIKEGAKIVAKQGRPIIIFPQGTRVATDVTPRQKPYKIGIARIQEATRLPIIPMALNTGVFWPRNSWIKKPGKVVFEFLPAIEAGLPADKLLKKLETEIEERSKSLMEEAENSLQLREKKKSRICPLLTFSLILLAVAAYCANWFIVAHQVKQSVQGFLDNIEHNSFARFTKKSPLLISGFPGKIHLNIGRQELLSPLGSVQVSSIHASSWPFPEMTINATIKGINIKAGGWKSALLFDEVKAQIIPRGEFIEIKQSRIMSYGSTARISGLIDLSQQPYPGIDLLIRLKNYDPFIDKLIESKIVRANPALLAKAAMKAMEKDGEVELNLRKDGRNIYLGPFKIIELPNIYRRDRALVYDAE